MSRVSSFRARAAFVLTAAVAVGAAPADEAGRGADWVQQRVEALLPTDEERRIDQIGWADDLRSALRLAEAHRRPAFVFTMDGRFDTGRC